MKRQRKASIPAQLAKAEDERIQQVIRLVGEEDGRTSTDPESIAERVDFDFIQPQGTESGL